MTKKRAAKGTSPRRPRSRARTRRSGPSRRAASPAMAGPKQLKALLKVLTDKDEPLASRREALRVLGAARFASPAFPSAQGDYVVALRKVAEDPDPELRQRVLGILAREKDGYAQQRLIEGLKRPDKALLPPEKALQLLGYDIHADAYPIAREIVRNPPSALAKREALRLLAADAASAPIIEAVLRDKREPSENRQICAAALHALKPAELQARAREILLDPTEDADVQDVSLTALTYFGGAATGSDQALAARVDQLADAGPPRLKDGARKFRARYRR